MTVRRRGRSRWLVCVESPDGTGRTTTPLMVDVTTVRKAFERVSDVLNQWAASEGAITPGAQISIVDKNDGGKLFEATYLGYEDTQLLGGTTQWQRLSESKKPRTWPR